MPTPPFSQDRRDWLTEISGLFTTKKTGSKESNATKATSSRAKLNVALPKAFDSVTTISTFGSIDHGSAKDQAMGDRPRRLG
jgi:hypothetical protein